MNDCRALSRPKFETKAAHPHWPPLPLMRGEPVVEAPADRSTLTLRHTEESARFIQENKGWPFFLYLAHAMPGSTDRPFSSPPFQGQSSNGPYDDSVEELDWSTGKILKTQEEYGISERTLLIWTSDNGAVRRDPPQGSNAPLRGWGYDTSEGGQRVTFIARWPGPIPAGAVRAGQWKLYLPLERKPAMLGGSLDGAVPARAELYDVRNDVSETRELSDEHLEIVRRLLELAEHARGDMGDLDREGANQRPAGWVKNPRPRLLPKSVQPRSRPKS